MMPWKDKWMLNEPWSVDGTFIPIYHRQAWAKAAASSHAHATAAEEDNKQVVVTTLVAERAHVWHYFNIKPWDPSCDATYADLARWKAYDNLSAFGQRENPLVTKPLLAAVAAATECPGAGPGASVSGADAAIAKERHVLDGTFYDPISFDTPFEAMTAAEQEDSPEAVAARAALAARYRPVAEVIAEFRDADAVPIVLPASATS